MAKSRDLSQVTANNMPDLVHELNFILQRFNDRLDALEGLRGSFETEQGGTFSGTVSVVDADDNQIHGFE